MRWRRAIYNALDRGNLRIALASAASAYATLKTRSACTVFWDGVWVHQYPAGIVVEPKLTLCTLSQIERQTVDYFMYQYIPTSGDIVVDLGAGTGRETLFFSRLVGSTGCVVSIEAHPRIFSCLQEMCRRNQLDNVVCLNCAVTDREGHLTISDSPEYLTNNIFAAEPGYLVPSRTLDEIVSSLHLPRIDLLKMNIEGAERLALPGMVNSIRLTHHACIACHDFLADRNDADDMRSKSAVRAFLVENRFDTNVRASDPRPEVRDCLYGRNRHAKSRTGVAS
jgi:FkbM family methyltransferase